MYLRHTIHFLMNNLFRSVFFPLSACLLLFSSSCSTEPGTGGTASISGKVFGYQVNMFGTKLDSGYVADQRVYLAYGDHEFADEDTRTSFNGSFRFDKLKKGSYTIWVVSQCFSCPMDQYIDKKTITVRGTREDADAGTLLFFDLK